MIRVLLADDENLIRSALAALLSMEDDLQVVAQAASSEEALAMARAHRPHVAVLDLQMPGLDGIAVAEALRSEVPGCASVIVTSHGRPGHLKRALAAGVGGFLPKTVSAHVLADVVRAVHGGGRYVDPELAAEAISAGDSPLTPREADVLELAADGVAIEEIAHRASLSQARSATTCPRQPPSSGRPIAMKPSMSHAPTAGSETGLRAPTPTNTNPTTPTRCRGPGSRTAGWWPGSRQEMRSKGRADRTPTSTQVPARDTLAEISGTR